MVGFTKFQKPGKSMQDNIKIAIIDDDIDYVSIFEEYLNNEIFNVNLYKFIPDGDTDISSIVSKLFDLDIIIIDFYMPLYNGIDIIYEYKKQYFTLHDGIEKHNPLFIMNTIKNNDSAIAVKAMNSGFDDFMTCSKDDIKYIMNILKKYINSRCKGENIINKFNEMVISGIV